MDFSSYVEHDFEIIWAAAIIEGEGCFSLITPRSRPKTKTARITVKMTDEDIIRRLQKSLGYGTVTGPYKRHSKNKPMWTWSVQNQEGCFNVLLKIMPYLGVRRLQKAKEMFEYLEPKVVK